MDEIWRKNSLGDGEKLSYEKALPVLQGFLMATQGIADCSEAEMQEQFGKIDKVGKGAITKLELFEYLRNNSL